MTGPKKTMPAEQTPATERITSVGRMTTPKKIALAGLLSSLAVALGFMLIAVPNVELMTLTVFVAGGLLDLRGGLLVGVVSMLIYSIANPMGVAVPLVTVSQVAGMAMVGAAGAATPCVRRVWKGRTARNIILASAGLLVTIAYDVLTNLALGLSMGTVAVVLAAGLVFSMVHFVSNALIFFFLADVLLSMGERL
ncbi:MAG: hypothetical protein NTX17_06875 [Candidatus Eisenbacteria bacterium]|nr:hypothetical protein [Candidatus Eisenbacteria bacterium]